MGLETRVGLKKPDPKKPAQKNPLKKTQQKWVLLGFFGFYWNSWVKGHKIGENT